MCSSLGLSCLGLSVLLDLFDYFLSHAGEVLAIISSDIFSGPFSLSSSETPIMQIVVRVMLSQRSDFISFHSFSYILSSRSLYPFFCPVVLLLIPSTVLFISVCLFVSSSRSLVSISCIFSILFPRFWIIFTIIILNSYSGQLPISTSFSCFSGVLSCPFI